jgi:CheY-like chemotaxis protein
MSLARHTILLVEDDPDDVILLQRLLGGLKLARPLQVVPTGELAVAYLDGEGKFANRQQYPQPTLLFLDLKLPGLSGFEVLTWIRQHPRVSRAQVVVLTGSRRSLDVYRACELGANSYLVKPVRPEDLATLAQNLKMPWLALAQPKAGAKPLTARELKRSSSRGLPDRQIISLPDCEAGGTS